MDESYPGQTAIDRPDLLASVFHLKCQSLIHDVRGGSSKARLAARSLALLAYKQGCLSFPGERR